MTEWLQGCEICNAGLVARFDELQSEGKSIREAARALEDEQVEQIGAVVYPAETLRTRLKRNKPVGSSEPKQNHMLEPLVASTERYIKREIDHLFALEPWEDPIPENLQERAKRAVVYLHIMINGICRQFDLEVEDEAREMLERMEPTK